MNSNYFVTGSLSFEEASLRAHNVFRKIHNAPNMKLDSVMSAEAAKYAEVIAQKGSLKHSSTEDGENLSMGCTSGKKQMSAEEATKNWYILFVFLYVNQSFDASCNYLGKDNLRCFLILDSPEH